MMKRMIFCAVLLMVCMACSRQAEQQPADPELRFNSNGKFKIAQFTDTHLGYDRKEVFDAAVKMMKNIIEQEKPDLVMLTGDIVTGNQMKEAFEHLLTPLDRMGIPFLYLMGNHEREGELPGWEMAEAVTSHPASLNTRLSGNLDDVAIRVMSADGTRLKAVLYGMDSNDYSVVPDHWDYGWISHTQIDWYRTKSQAFTRANGNLPVPSYTFIHIPLTEYAEADRDGHLTGLNNEGVFSAELNSGMLAAMEECADVHGVFCGHDHSNDFVSKLGAVAQVYGRCSGDGHPDRGARIIELTEGDYGFRTWIREHDGDVVQDYTYHYPVDYRLRKASSAQAKEPGVRCTRYTGVTSLEDIETRGKAVSTQTVEHPRVSGNEGEPTGFVFEGMLYVPETSLWTLHIMADEHGSFTIDDFTFRDTDWHRGLKRVYLEEGYHPIKIKLFTKDYHVLKLQWRPQEVDRLTEIPKANFFVE